MHRLWIQRICEYKCTNEERQRKRKREGERCNAWYFLNSAPRSLNCKDRWCNYRVVTRRLKEKIPISHCHAPKGGERERRSQIFPYPRISLDTAMWALACDSGLSYPSYLLGGPYRRTPRGRRGEYPSLFFSLSLSLLSFLLSRRVFHPLSLFRHLISLLRTSGFVPWAKRGAIRVWRARNRAKDVRWNRMIGDE